MFFMLVNYPWVWGLPCHVVDTRCKMWAAFSVTTSFLFTFTGLCFSKPSVIFLLEQGKEPWRVRTELMGSLSTGECRGNGQDL